MKFLLILVLITISSAKKCNDGFSDIHSMISSLYDYINLIESNLRVQYYNFQTERLNTIINQLSFMKSLQNGFFTETCNYQLIEEGHGIYISTNEYFNVIRKNVNYALKSAIDDLKSDSLNYVYVFMQHHTNMVDQIAQLSINLFNDGKLCVMNMESDIKTFFDTTVKKMMDAMKKAAQTDSLNVPSIGSLRGSLQGSFGQLAHYSRAYFGGTSRNSNKQSNETVAKNYNNYMKGMFNTVFEMGTKMSQVGLDTIAAIEAHSFAMKNNIVLFNTTYLMPKRVEILGKIENVCSGL